MGDVLAPPADDGAFGPVHMDYPIVLFQRNETVFYVSSMSVIVYQVSH